MKISHLVIALSLLFSTFTVNTFASNVEQVNRYATVSLDPSPAQKNPLVAVSSFKFRSDVVTVGDAVSQVLDGTGYTLANESKMEKVTQDTLNKPLPLVDRNIGPMSIQNILLVLMGTQIFDIQVDFGHRLVNFKVKSKYKKLYQ